MLNIFIWMYRHCVSLHALVGFVTGKMTPGRSMPLTLEQYTSRSWYWCLLHIRVAFSDNHRSL